MTGIDGVGMTGATGRNHDIPQGANQPGSGGQSQPKQNRSLPGPVSWGATIDRLLRCWNLRFRTPDGKAGIQIVGRLRGSRPIPYLPQRAGA